MNIEKIPKYDELLIPLLQALLAHEQLTPNQAVSHIAKNLKLPEHIITAKSPQNTSILKYRLGWASTYLTKAGLMDKPRRGLWQITDKGKIVYKQNFNLTTLKAYMDTVPSFLEFTQSKSKNNKNDISVHELESYTPEDLLNQAYAEHNSKLKSDLLDELHKTDPTTFEKIVNQLLVAMGYGEIEQAHGKSGDGGIDGIIQEDKLGFSHIYVQAKRWQGNVPEADIQRFAGSLGITNSKKGVFITTSGYTKSAQEYAQKHKDYKIILIDGDKLCDLMIQYNLGVSTYHITEFKKLDQDFWTEMP